MQVILWARRGTFRLVETDHHLSIPYLGWSSYDYFWPGKECSHNDTGLLNRDTFAYTNILFSN